MQELMEQVLFLATIFGKNKEKDEGLLNEHEAWGEWTSSSFVYFI